MVKTLLQTRGSSLYANSRSACPDSCSRQPLCTHTLQVLSHHACAGVGIDSACAGILSQRLGRDVFIVGAANVGKSAFVRRMLKEMGSMASRHFDMKASMASRHLPVESAMPGTTLGRVKLGAFSSGGDLYDTPGACRPEKYSRARACSNAAFRCCLHLQEPYSNVAIATCTVSPC